MGLFTSDNPVFEMLKADHEKVKKIFDEFKEAKGRSRSQLVAEAIKELDVHTALEETLIYPAIRGAINEDDLMDEALEEHHVAHVLIQELKRMSASDERYAAKFTVLGESVKHHIREEEGEMFPKAEKAEISWEHLHEQVLKRKEALLAKKQQTNKGTHRRAASKGTRKAHQRN